MKLIALYLTFSLLSAFMTPIIGLCNDLQAERSIEAISKMVQMGSLSQEEANQQISQIQISQGHESPGDHKQYRSIASTITKQEVIELTNEPIEIQVK